MLIYLAVYFVKNWSSYTRLAVDLYAIVPAVIILGLSIIFLVAAVTGFYGTCRNNRCCLGVVKYILFSYKHFAFYLSNNGQKAPRWHPSLGLFYQGGLNI